MAKMIESVASRARTPFKNEPLTDFTKPEKRQAQFDALEQVKPELGKTYPLLIGGKKITNEATFASVNPSQPDQVVGYFSRARSSRPTKRCRRRRRLLKAGNGFRRKSASAIFSRQPIS